MSNKISRRDFLKISGLGAASAAVLVGCGPLSRYVKRQPYTEMPEYSQTGVSTYYATTCRECPAGCGLVVRTMEGRAIKVEGNPKNPVNLGKVCSRGLTTVQSTYNPDRIKGPMMINRGKNQQQIDWKAGTEKVQQALAGAPDGIAFLVGLAPDHLFDLVTELTKALGSPAPVRYNAYAMFEGRTTLVQAAKAVYGTASFPYFDMGSADVVFSFGANFLETWLSPLAYSRSYSQMRKQKLGKRGHLVVFEPRRSVTSGVADDWLPIRPGSEGVVALALLKLAAQKMGKPVPAGVGDVDIPAVEQVSGISEAQLNDLADLFANQAANGKVLAIPGGSVVNHASGLEATKAILALNLLANNQGLPGGVWLVAEPPDVGTMKDVQELIQRMNDGKVETLFIHGLNPAFDLPLALGFIASTSKVKNIVSFSSFPDETVAICDVVLPDHTGLESWGYQRSLAGADRITWSGAQPVVVPLYNTKSTVDVLLAGVKAVGGDLAAKINYKDEVDFLQKKLVPFQARTDGTLAAPEIKTFWALWLQAGGWWQKDTGLQKPAVVTNLSVNLSPNSVKLPEGEKLHLHVYPTQMGDGSGANKPWLQETPDPMTTVMWNSWIEVSPVTAAKLGITDDDLVKVKSDTGEIEAVVYKYPALRPDTVAMPFGQGHTAFGKYAQDRGSNPANILLVGLNEAGDLAFGDTLVTITPTGKQRPISRMESREGVYGDQKPTSTKG